MAHIAFYFITIGQNPKASCFWYKGFTHLGVRNEKWNVHGITKSAWLGGKQILEKKQYICSR